MTSQKNTRRLLPTQERLRELLDYDLDTGVFRWRVSPAPNVKVGDVAGNVTSRGYRNIAINNISYFAHRLAFVWVTGNCPNEIDHIDRIPGNNAWCNLRPATRSQNCGNFSLSRKNTSGVKGVHWNARDKKWQACIRINGRRKSLGYFSDLAEAASAYKRAAIAQWGKFANHFGHFSKCF